MIHLNCNDGGVEVRENYGFATGDLRRIREKLNHRLHELCKAWEKIHGIE